MSNARRRKQPNPSKARRAQNRDGDFWGVESTAAVDDIVDPHLDPTVLIASLGPPPLVGVDAEALYPLGSVYDKAAALATAVAAASGLVRADDTEADDTDE
jgi:hypothetical protein